MGSASVATAACSPPVVTMVNFRFGMYPPTRRLLHTLNIGGGDVSNPAFSPDGKLLAAGTYEDGTVTLVDPVSGKILSQVKVAMFGCGSVAFSPDGRFLVTPSNGGLIGPRRFDRGGSVRVFRIEN